jgi:hypothetical protein
VNNKEFNPNLADRRNQQGKCGICGRSLKNNGIARYTDGSTLEEDAESFGENSGCMLIIVGSECVKKKEI